MPLLLLAVLPSCAVDHVGFRPREHVDGESPDGYAAASYALRPRDDISATGGADSELRLWSPGVERNADKAAPCVVRIGIEIENRFDRPLTIDVERTRVVDVETDAGTIAELPPPRTAGPARFEPGDVHVLGLTYDLPMGVEPADVRSFAVRWLVSGAAEFEQYTAFRRAPRRDPRSYSDWPYYGHPPIYFRPYRGYFFAGAPLYCW